MFLKLLDPVSKINRMQYFSIFIATNFLTALSFFIIELALKDFYEVIEAEMLIPAFLLTSLLAYLQIVSTINRARDIGYSPYSALIVFLPLLNILYIIALLFKSGKNNNPEFNENQTYALISKELDTGDKNQGVWLKAFQLAEGDETKTKLKYIKLRFEELKKTEYDSHIVASKNAPKRNKKYFVIALFSVFLLTSLLYGYFKISTNNDIASETSVPRPFFYKSHFPDLGCAVPSYPEDKTLQDIEQESKDGKNAVINHADLPKYYLYSKNKDFQKAHQILEDRVRNKIENYEMDAYLLGQQYECGYSKDKDIHKAISYYEQGKHWYELARIYYLGKSIPSDYEKAFENISKYTAESNYKTDLAGMYYYGLGTKKDLKKSFKLMKSTIDHFDEHNITNDIEDCFNLGLMYYYGFGTSRNPQRADALLRRVLDMQSQNEYSNEIKLQAKNIIEKINEK